MDFAQLQNTIIYGILQLYNNKITLKKTYKTGGLL